MGRCPVQAGLGDGGARPSGMPTSARARRRRASVPQDRDWTDGRVAAVWGGSGALEGAQSRVGRGSTSLSKPSRAPWRRRSLGWDLEDKETLFPAKGHRQGGQTGVGRALGEVRSSACLLSRKTPPPPADSDGDNPPLGLCGGAIPPWLAASVQLSREVCQLPSPAQHVPSCQLRWEPSAHGEKGIHRPGG